MIRAESLGRNIQGLLNGLARGWEVATSSLGFTQSEQRIGVLERGTVGSIPVYVHRFTQQLLTLAGVARVNEAAIVAKRRGHQHVIRSKDFLAQLESSLII